MVAEFKLDLMLPWQNDVWSLLAEYLSGGRPPQALLITGQSGLGKFHLAKQLSQTLVCQQRQDNGMACSNCLACQLFLAQTHPDTLIIQPEDSGKWITIKHIRELLEVLTLKPHYEQYRAVIINPAQQMNLAATNALLKCLEEPPKRTLIILVADRVASLTATIVSRCQQLSLKVPAIELTKHWLKSVDITDNIDALINATAGMPFLIYRYANENLLATRKTCFANWCAIAKQQVSPIQIAKLWFMLATDDLLAWLQSWIVDLIKLQSTQYNTAMLVNTDLLKPLLALAEKLKTKDMFIFYDLLIISRQRLQTQLNKQLIFEEILINWSSYNKTI